MITILVIDDEKAMHMTIQAVVPDWTVLSAPDGVIGLELLRKHRATLNLIVLDIAMPYLNGYDTCLRIREIAPDIPILPFTGVNTQATLQFLDELHCAPSLLKPVDSAILETALRATVNTIPPPLTDSGVRKHSQLRAAENEQAGRQARQMQVLVCAERWRDRHTLTDILTAANLRVSLDTAHTTTLQLYLASTGEDKPKGRAFLLATVADELPMLAVFARERNLPILALAFDLRTALRLAEQVQEVGDAWPPVAIIVDHPTDPAVVPPQVSAAATQLQAGTSALSNLLTAPFANAPLSPQEQAALALALHGLTSNEIGLRINTSGNTVRAYFARIRDKQGLAGDEDALLRWAEDWWYRELRRSVAGERLDQRERAL